MDLTKLNSAFQKAFGETVTYHADKLSSQTIMVTRYVTSTDAIITGQQRGTSAKSIQFDISVSDVPLRPTTPAYIVAADATWYIKANDYTAVDGLWTVTVERTPLNARR